MADDETKQLLREILATQQEALEVARKANEVYLSQSQAYTQSLEATKKQDDERIRGMTETYERQAKAHDEATVRHEQALRATNTANNVANILRAVALVAIAAVLAYLVLFGLHRH